MILERIFPSSLIYATIRSATPIIYAALCASITQQADILNIGTEGIMLVGAFAAVAVSYLTGSWVLAVGVAMLAGLVMGLIIAVGHIRYKADNCALGIGVWIATLPLCGLQGHLQCPDGNAIGPAAAQGQVAGLCAANGRREKRSQKR